jgi:polysaccharide biosynthesis transport protein
MLRERWLIGLLVGAAAAAAILYFQPERAPLYRTEVYLLFSTKKDRVLNIAEVVDTSLQTTGELNTHIEQLRSKTFFEYLLVSFSAEETTRIQAAYLDPDKPDEPPPSLAMIIRPQVSVFVRRGTPIVGIAVANRDPENAALIANRYARKYIDYNLDRANTGTNSAIVFLHNQAEDMRRQVGLAETALQTYRARHNMAALGENQNVITQKLASLGATLVRTQMEQIELRSLLDTVETFARTDRPLIDMPAVLASGALGQLRAQVDTLISQRALLAERYLARHPRMRDNEIQIAEARRQITEGAARIAVEFRTRHEVAARYEAQLRSEMRAMEEHARELDKVSVDYQFLEQEAQTKRSAYVRIIDRLNDASISSQLEDLNIRIFDRAWVAAAPADDSLATALMLATAAGLGGLLLVPIGLGLCDTRIKSTGQVEIALGEKLLGLLPWRKSPAPDQAQAFLHDTDEALTEAYRGLYGEIEIASSLAYPKTLLVTSSLPHEGKSSIASNLAAVFASHGRRTLLVDCDLRRPTLHEYFEVDGDEGWIQWMQTPADSRPSLPAAIRTIAPRLDLLPAGAIPTNCTQLLEQFAQVGIQRQLLGAYDLVIFDTPPATIFPDALLMARACHELIYICRFGLVPLNKARRTLSHLHATGVRSLGVIMNQMPATGGEQGYYSYGAKSVKYYRTYANSRRHPA